MRHRPDAGTRYIRYQFHRCRATVAAHFPGTREWCHRFWLREGVMAAGELGLVFLGAFALWRLTAPLGMPARLVTEGLGYLLLSGRLILALPPLITRIRALRRDVAHYRAHRAYVDAQILNATVALLTAWSISEEQLIAAGLLPTPRDRPANLRPRTAPAPPEG
ncbi:hypothetical protein [Acidiferrobacter thiooxydans]|uniref:Uncharacterized protein n=1 Tax=Acidiferrobacter thiooxydans TaxID=163359 RepID=A0A368HFP1_9GAMM|nr:hypothetical protein [Acidiferrobacter thiooxydans]RCN56291.1 hypothetical protein C4900_10640 [Acidiferrobacter thiooxydans]